MEDPSQAPAALGYRMPAEWEAHAATWLSWPRREGISFPDSFDRVTPALRAMVEVLIESEQVCINICNGVHEAEAREVLRGLPVISIRNPPQDGFAVANLRLWIGITTPGATNIRHSIWMKWRQRASQKFSMFRCFIRA